jgi:6-phosphogluconolactonase
MPPPPEIRVLSGIDDLIHAAADEFAALAQSAVRAHGKFCVALSGGSTPKGLYSLLASGVHPETPWDKTYFFFSDERHVPPDDADSNYRMANDALLSKIGASHVFRIHAEDKDASAVALAYEKAVAEFFHLAPGEFPSFDLVLLGLGPDGHTASLFPGTAALHEKTRLAVANWVEKLSTERITFTFPVLNHAACVIFLVSGPEKAPALHQIFVEGENLPARRVQPIEGRLVWLIDRAAGAFLSSEPQR